MKKTLSILIATVLVCAMFAPIAVLPAAAAVNIDVNLNYGKAAIDGNFSADKWAAATPFTVDTANSVAWSGDVTASLTVYGLWDEQGLYFGGEVKDSTFTYSDSSYGGDAIQFSLDVGQSFLNTDEGRAIFYSFGAYENAADHILVRQESANDGEVADGEGGFALKTSVASGGWKYEMFMPWSMLNEDLNLKAGKTFTPAAGGKVNVLICYLDREDGALISAFGTFTEDDPDWGPAGHGITLVLQAEPVPEPEPEPEPAPVANDSGAAEPAPAPAPTEAPARAPSVPTGDSTALLLVLALLSAGGFVSVKRFLKAR